MTILQHTTRRLLFQRAITTTSTRAATATAATTVRGGAASFPILDNDRSMAIRTFSQTRKTESGTVPITYVEADGTEKTVNAEIGQNMMQVAHDNDIELEGACGGELACSTCHLIFEKEIYDTLPEKEEEEDDMLDLAFEVTETSRLGCQILVQEHFAGTKVKIPDDGF